MNDQEEWGWEADAFVAPWDDDGYDEDREWKGVGWEGDLLTPLDKYESLR